MDLFMHIGDVNTAAYRTNLLFTILSLVSVLDCSDLFSVMADNLHLVLNKQNIYQLMYDGRSHVLKHTNFDEKQWTWSRVTNITIVYSIFIDRHSDFSCIIRIGCNGAVTSPHANTCTADHCILYRMIKRNTLNPSGETKRNCAEIYSA
ncbi:conserved hypothetical protein [Trichinella spiralis]|uniref:hypothetical protein n=1 Tax=Trichinella spiralis TaxID=6334 RepID=UPI0001EFEBF8|nr:conserved hypothetical protein [Trichinella spiralis]